MFTPTSYIQIFLFQNKHNSLTLCGHPLSIPEVPRFVNHNGSILSLLPPSSITPVVPRTLLQNANWHRATEGSFPLPVLHHPALSHLHRVDYIHYLYASQVFFFLDSYSRTPMINRLYSNDQPFFFCLIKNMR